MLRPYQSSDYAMIKDWMGRRGFPVPPEQFLPDDGFVVGDYAAGFLYVTSSGNMAWLEWVSANPDKTAEERSLGLDALLFHVEQIAKEKGMLAIFSSSKLDAYGKVLERNGFQKSDDGVTHYLRSL